MLFRQLKVGNTIIKASIVKKVL